MVATSESDDHPPPGVVELREDVPLKPSGLESRRCAGPRLIAGAFAALTVAITLALLTQIYYGDYEVVPHGSVSSPAGACSRGGTALLRVGGLALDAAAATALCLATVAPYATALDASGSLLYWEYRRAHNEAPLLAEWGAVGEDWNSTITEAQPRAPRLLAALAELHARYGVLPWSAVLQPAINSAGSSPAAIAIVEQLKELQNSSSIELCAAWRCEAAVRLRAAPVLRAGAWRAFAGAAPGEALRRALAANWTSVVEWLQQSAASNASSGATSGASSGAGRARALAVADPRGTYVALALGVSNADGVSLGEAAAGEAGSAASWARDEPTAPLDLAPAIIAHEHICGTRYVIGAESTSALAQTAASLLAGATPADAVEAPRAAALRGDAAVNLLRQRADALLSHADSRAGGLASRF